MHTHHHKLQKTFTMSLVAFKFTSHIQNFTSHIQVHKSHANVIKMDDGPS